MSALVGGCGADEEAPAATDIDASSTDVAITDASDTSALADTTDSADASHDASGVPDVSPNDASDAGTADTAPDVITPDTTEPPDDAGTDPVDDADPTGAWDVASIAIQLDGDVGALDLHVAHPFASVEDHDGDGSPDPWFDTTFDCFRFNAEPNWHDLGTDEDDPRWAQPSGTRELVYADALEDGRAYAVGVHNTGDSSASARVRIWSFGDRVIDVEQTLAPGDLWNLGRMTYLSAGLIACEADCVTADYPSFGE